MSARFCYLFSFLALELNEEVVEGGHISEFFKIILIYVGISKYSLCIVCGSIQ